LRKVKTDNAPPVKAGPQSEKAGFPLKFTLHYDSCRDAARTLFSAAKQACQNKIRVLLNVFNLFCRFALYLVELQAEAVELFLAFFVLAVGVAQMSAEDFPVAAEVAKRSV